MDLDIDTQDLQILYLHTKQAYNNCSFEVWCKHTAKAFTDYYKRNLANLEKFGKPKTYSEWVNGQILALT